MARATQLLVELEESQNELAEFHLSRVIAAELAGEVFLAASDYARAERSFARALEINQRGQSADRIEESRLLHKFAQARSRPETAESALELASRSLQMRRSIFGDDYYTVSDTALLVGEIQALLGQTEAAKASFAEALRIRREVYPAGDADIAQAADRLAQLSKTLDAN